MLKEALVIAVIELAVIVLIMVGGVMWVSQPTVVDTTNAVYTGSISGPVHYDVMILDGVDTNFVVQSLQYIPQWIEFTIVEPNAAEYKINDEGIKVPTRDNLIVVCADSGKAKYAGLAYIGDGNGHRVAVIKFDTDSHYRFGMRVYHEVLHTVENGCAADKMMSDVGFPLWAGMPLRDHSIQWERLYYDYLSIKLRGDSV
jgi:hypothetical protein